MRRAPGVVSPGPHVVTTSRRDSVSEEHYESLDSTSAQRGRSGRSAAAPSVRACVRGV